MCTTISSFRQEGGERERREAWGKKKERNSSKGKTLRTREIHLFNYLSIKSTKKWHRTIVKLRSNK